MGGGSRVLIVDDHVMLRDAIRVALELADHRVVGEAGNASEALELVDQLRPSIVLMDVTLPGMDGIEATRRVRARQPETQVVILTMHGDPTLVPRAVRAGASAYLTKTFSMQDVVATVQSVADGDVALSSGLARSMLRELKAPAYVRRALITKRETAALQLVADGYSTHEVASRLLVSDRTLRHDLSSAYDKLEARDLTAAALDGVQWGIVAFEHSSSAASEG